MAYLIPEDGPEAGRPIPLSESKVVLGRHPDCGIVLETGAVSRQHAQVLQVGDDYFVEDLNSRNGTFVNDQRLEQRRQLAEGDVLAICGAAFVFRRKLPELSPSLADPPAGSSFSAVLIDDATPVGNSTIMSRLDFSSGSGTWRMSSSPEVRLAALLEITQSLGKAVSLDEVLTQVLNSLFQIFVQADRGFIVLRDAAGNLIPRWTKLRRERNGEGLRISRTIVGQVIESRQAILSADAASDVRFEMSQSMADFRIRSMMCAPLIDSQGHVLGALQVDALDQRHRFRDEDLEVLASVATAAAVAIDNAQLHENALRQRELEHDLALAHEVQRGFLPGRSPQLTGYHFYDFYRAANHVGGDYYDYLALADGRLAVVVADVVGHGIAAALLMAKLSAAVHACLASQPQPGEALTQLNRLLLRDQSGDRFVTLVLGVLEPNGARLTVASAGHNPPLLRRTGGQLEELARDAAGFPLCVSDDVTYEQQSVGLEGGDLVVMYTDGLTEAMDGTGGMYGIARLKRQLLGTGGAPAAGQQIIEDIARFVGQQPQTDDMCLVCFGRDAGGSV